MLCLSKFFTKLSVCSFMMTLMLALLLPHSHSKAVTHEEQEEQSSWDVWYTSSVETFNNIRAYYEQEGREEDNDRIIYDKDGGCDSDYADDE